MKVVWTPEALQDRTDIWDTIAADSPTAAVRIDELFSSAAARLTQHPLLGKPGKVSGTRELIPHESGARQDSCRPTHAIRRFAFSASIWSRMTASRSGFKVTASIGVQLRVGPDQRAGLRSRAWRYVW